MEPETVRQQHRSHQQQERQRQHFDRGMTFDDLTPADGRATSITNIAATIAATMTHTSSAMPTAITLSSRK